MKQIPHILLLIVLAVLFLSCEKEEETQVLGSVCGIVVDKNTGKSIQNAGVELKSSGLKTVTGADGLFEFPKVEPNTYYLFVTKAGYKDFTSSEIVVKGNADPKKVDIQLEPLPPALTIVDDHQQEIDSIDFGADEGENIRSFHIFNNSEDILTWSIIRDCIWISDISIEKGKIKANASQPIYIKINRSELQTGKNFATLIISSDNGNKDLRLIATKGNFIETLSPSDIRPKSVILNGEILRMPSSPIIDYGFVYSPNMTPSLQNGATKIQMMSEPVVAKFSFSVDSLNVDTKYFVRAYAIDAQGIHYGESKEFRTPTGVPSITTITPSSTSNTITTGGNITSDGGYSIIERGICYSNIHRFPEIEEDMVITQGGDTGRFNLIITGLEANSEYYIRAYARNSYALQYGDVYAIKTLTTAGESPRVTTQNPTSTATTIASGGIITFDGGSNVHTCGLCYSQTHDTPTLSDSYVIANKNSNVFDATITNLLQNTTYYIRAFAINSNGTGYGEPLSITTLNGSITISTSAISDITSESAIGGYKITGISGVTIRTAGICWSTSKNPTITDNISTGGITIGTYTCSMGGLSPNTTYYVRAYAVSELGDTYGEQKSFKTLPVSDYVDLGLPSGTKWRDHNETNRCQYGSRAPSKVQWEELKNLCTWRWVGDGYMVTGLNGNYIILPAKGYEYDANVWSGGTPYGVGTWGYYWTRDDDPNNYTMGISKSDYSAWAFVFNQSNIYFALYNYTDLLSLRLVQK